ncbi:uncharacterized protein TM35_000182240 [Trypanosoma theileri]|uniref:DNA repair protein Rad9 n=1 Tax=Trypanosoma theileri TaxID=67003 RepID=A0A1X0NTX6_9TRYP|nr:uncharacterized protein TM35_000182240 [Trypanosoma theileri]ORC88167.1 hypothetical protein TM35_000182240 [Trypanosoma theileri]
MFLSFSVTGVFLRPFVQLLQTAAKQGDGLFFEPHNDVLLLRAVNSSRSTHFLVTIAASHLEAYRCKRNSGHHTHDNNNNNSSSSSNNNNKHNNNNNNDDESPNRRDSTTDIDHTDLTDVQGNDKTEFHLLLPTKALMATVLRQAQGLSAIHLHYDGTTQCDEMGESNCDTLQWECVMSCGIVKKFALPLAEGQPERAFVPPDRFIFDACAAAREWGALLGCFPQSTPRVVLQPLPSGLKLWVLADADINNGNGAQPSLDAHKNGAAETMVVASHEHFLFVQMHSQQQQQQQGEGQQLQDGEKNMIVRRTMLLPGKIIEVRPFKQVCMLADQLGMMIRVRSGEEGLPLFLEAITTDEARQATSNAAIHSSAFTTDNNNNNNHNHNYNTTVAPQALFHKHSIPVEQPFQVTFSMYIAAFDVPQSALENSEHHRTSGRRSTNSTAITSAEDAVVMGVSSENLCSDPSITTCGEAVMPSENVLPTATKTVETSSVTARDLLTALTMPSANQHPPHTNINMNTVSSSTTTTTTTTMGELDYAAGSASSPPHVLVAASPTQGRSEYTNEPSMVNASTTTPIHENCRLSSSSSVGAIVMKGTPEGGGIITQRSHSKRSREGREDVSASPLHQHISPSVHTTHTTINTTTGNVGKSPSFVAATNTSSCAPLQNQQKQQQQQQQWPQLSSLNGVAESPINARHPLDFNAFMREIAEEANEEMYDDEEDEDLQRFLESCASMLVLPATPSTQPE